MADRALVLAQRASAVAIERQAKWARSVDAALRRGDPKGAAFATKFLQKAIRKAARADAILRASGPAETED